MLKGQKVNKLKGQFNTFNTIYAIGDVHGDIIPLIVCLRDCCQVIKSNNSNYQELLSLEYNDKNYVDDLNFDWIANDKTAVVLCGDILDNTRGPIDKKPGEYPFEEARILKFINAINKKGGHIFKVLGNHDMHNLNGIVKTKYSSFVSNYAKNYSGYKQGAKNRLEYFNKGKPGAELIGEGGAYLFLMIRDFIFVHGGISSELLSVENLNQLNDTLEDYITNKNNKLDINSDTIESNLTYSDDNTKGLVLDRFFGFKHTDENTTCNKLYDRFKVLCDDLGCESKNLNLVIGHCVQNKASIDSNRVFNYTYSDVINSDNIKIELGGEIKETKQGGITISCYNNDKFNKPSIFRVDVGLSRGFNFGIGDEYYKSKLPQVLKIEYENEKPKTTIIKTTYKNAIDNIPDFTTNPYLSKYLKYKQKYNSLLKKFN
jgi:hypothetical protein